MSAIITDVERVAPNVVAAFREVDSATVHEASGRQGALDHAIKPLAPGITLCGPAFTVWAHPADNLMLHYAVALAQPGDVLVVDGGGFCECALWGEILSVAAAARGLAGLVIDGAVRDVRALRRLGFPVFTRGVSMKGPGKSQPGRINHPIVCGGVLVRAGDLVLGDDDGVVVVQRECASDVLAAARAREAKEAHMMDELRAGALTLDLLAMRPTLRQLDLA